MQQHVRILDVRVDSITSDELLGTIEETARHNKKKVFAYVTAHAFNLASADKEFKDFLNSASLSFADGEGVRLGAKILGKSLPPRIPLTRWVWELAEFCEKKELSMYLLGSTEQNVQRASEKLMNRFQKLKLLGCHHGYFEKFGNESNTIVQTINALAPNVLLVGFGMPVQERWIQMNKEKLNVNAILTAGSCFDFVAGALPDAPPWLTESGFEWLFRLMLEPKRLFKRYVVGNPQFVIRVLLQRLQNGKSPS